MTRCLTLSSLALFLVLSACAPAPPSASHAASPATSPVKSGGEVLGRIGGHTEARRRRLDRALDAGAGRVDHTLVTIVEFGDLQCPFCRRAHVTINELRRSYGDKLRVAFRNLPLPFHPHAARAAEAAMAAAAQGKFGEYG